jgi:hypothetical protein
MAESRILEHVGEVSSFSGRLPGETVYRVAERKARRKLERRQRSGY